jgi:uncharacterized protein with FMN-binding domain
MRRAVPVVVATAGAIALLANFHTSPAPSVIAAGPTQAPTPTPTTSKPSRSGGAAPTTTAPAQGGPPMAPNASRTVDGPVVRTEYGDVQVRVTLQGKKIVDVTALKLPNDRARSERISEQAGPLLRSEALQAQNANIDLLSGASYTSSGYARSLQGALDRATQ